MGVPPTANAKKMSIVTLILTSRRLLDPTTAVKILTPSEWSHTAHEDDIYDRSYCFIMFGSCNGAYEGGVLGISDLRPNTY